MSKTYTAADFENATHAVKGDKAAYREQPAYDSIPWFVPGVGYTGDQRLSELAGWTPVTTATKALSPREHLDAAYEAAAEPEDGRVREGESTIYRDSDGKLYVTERWNFAPSSLGRYRLIDPRTRPEGAEALDDKVNTAVRGLDLTTEAGRRALADALASDGVTAA